MTARTVKSLAKEIASEMLKKDNGLVIHTIHLAFEYYFKTKKISPATMAGKKSLYDQLEDFGYTYLPINELNGAKIREFITKLDLKDSSSHALYSRLMSVLNHYVRDHNLKIELPVGLIKNPKPKDAPEDTFITWTEIQILLAAVHKDKFFIDLFCVQCLTGMALNDVLKFDPKQNISEDGKRVIYNRKKTGAKCSLPLFPHLKEIIARNEWPCKYSTRTVQYRCDTVISDFLGRKIKTHDGRKAYGCLCLTLGFSIESTSKFMGHSNPIITSRIYSKVLNEKVENELNNLPEYAKQMMGL